MKKRILIIIFIIIILIIPFFIFNEGEAKDNNIIKKEKSIKKLNSYSVESDNINEYIKENIKEEIRENIVIVEAEEISKEDKFKYITIKYDNINEYIRENIVEEEKEKYVCIKEEKKIEDNKIRAIDISSWQGDIDFEKVKNSYLVDYVIVRIGYGTTLNDDPVLDSKFKRNISELKRLNIPFGVYIFGYAQDLNASNIEVSFIDNLFKEYNISKDTYIWYDAELTTFKGFYYSKAIYNMVIDNFVFRLNELGYKNVGVYGNLYMLTKGSLSYEKKYPVWVAQYNSKCEYEGEYKGWQYTSDGHVDGINGRVDMNYFY